MRALVISGGGAKFWYGAGVLHGLKQQGNQFDIVVGSSTGAICTLLWMKGEPGSARQLADIIKPEEFFSGAYTFSLLGRIARRKPLLNNSSMLGAFSKYFPINQLDFSFQSFVVSSNIVNQERVVFPLLENDDNIYRYVVSSTSIPVLFPPVVFNKQMICIDGSVTDNHPLSPAIQKGATEIVMVSMAPPLSNVDPNDSLSVMAATIDGNLKRQLKRDLQVTELKNSIEGFKKISVTVIRPKQDLPIGMLKWTCAEARNAFDLGYLDAFHAEQIT